MASGIYSIHSVVLPGIYLSPCVYTNLALIQVNTVDYCITYLLVSLCGPALLDVNFTKFRNLLQHGRHQYLTK